MHLRLIKTIKSASNGTWCFFGWNKVAIISLFFTICCCQRPLWSFQLLNVEKSGIAKTKQHLRRSLLSSLSCIWPLYQLKMAGHSLLKIHDIVEYKTWASNPSRYQMTPWRQRKKQDNNIAALTRWSCEENTSGKFTRLTLFKTKHVIVP